MFKTSMIVFTMISGAFMNATFAQAYMPLQEVSNAADLSQQIHDNNFVFHYASGVFVMEYTNLSAKVTPGQEGGGPTAATYPDHLQVYLGAGRHGDAGVASDFKAYLYNDPSHMYGLTAGLVVTSAMPDYLNFYISGYLSINGEPIGKDKFLLGQGHFASVNNWWLGSNSAPYALYRRSNLEVYSYSGRPYCIVSYNHFSPNEVTVNTGTCK